MRSSAAAEEARRWETIGTRGWQCGNMVVREHTAVGEDGCTGKTRAVAWQRNAGSTSARAARRWWRCRRGHGGGGAGAGAAAEMQARVRRRGEINEGPP